MLAMFGAVGIVAISVVIGVVEWEASSARILDQAETPLAGARVRGLQVCSAGQSESRGSLLRRSKALLLQRRGVRGRHRRCTG